MQPKLIYPTGPHRLKPSDIPGYQPPEGKSLEDMDEEQTDNWGWFRRDEATGSYRGFDEGMLRVAETIKENDGVDGVIGFSQGGAMAALVAAALEADARPVPQALEAEDSWANQLREANGGKALRFAVVYSGFVARDEALEWMYEGGGAGAEAGIQTPSLHFIGGLDTVVDEDRSRGLAEKCRQDRTRVIVHPGVTMCLFPRSGRRRWLCGCGRFSKSRIRTLRIRRSCRMGISRRRPKYVSWTIAIVPWWLNYSHAPCSCCQREDLLDQDMT